MSECQKDRKMLDAQHESSHHSRQAEVSRGKVQKVTGAVRSPSVDQGALGNHAGSGHQPVPNELACEVSSPVSCGMLLSSAKDRPECIAVPR